MSNGTITIRKNSLWKYSTFVLGALVIVLVIALLNSNSGGVTGNVVADSSAPSPGPSAQPSGVSANVDDDAVLGNPDAPITIVEFSDYQCSFCARFWSQTLPSLKAEYINTGKANFVYRDLPLNSIHPMAQKAAEATECIRDAGGDEAFWAMHDKIFENQRSITEENLKSWGQELGYDISTCLDSGKFAGEVRNDIQDAQRAGGRGTPYVVINGKALSGGACPFSAFQQAIDAELAGKSWSSPGNCQVVVN
ncbi:MAG: DsbA family protein [Nanoarchaeota archaeon]